MGYNFFTYWSSAEDHILKLHWDRKHFKKISKITKRSERAVRNRAQKLGLPRIPPLRPPWSKEQDQYLKNTYRELTAREIANVLGVTRNAVIGRANRLGLNVSKPKKVMLNGQNNPGGIGHGDSPQITDSARSLDERSPEG